MKFFLAIGLVTLVLLCSCNKDIVHSETVALAPTENILMLFERYESLGDPKAIKWKKHFSEFKGNVLILKNKRSAINYVQAHAPEILLDPQLKFVFDTAGSQHNLFAIDQAKAFLLQPTTIVQAGPKSRFLLKLTPQKKLGLSKFFVEQIGKELLLIDKDGFVAGATQLSKTNGGNLLITTADELAMLFWAERNCLVRSFQFLFVSPIPLVAEL